MSTIALLFAASLAAITGIIHSWLGERRLIGPLLAAEHRSGPLAISAFARRVLRFAWHLTSLAWCGSAAILIALALTPLDLQGRMVLGITAAVFLLNGLICLMAGGVRHIGWPFFFIISAAAIVPLLSQST